MPRGIKGKDCIIEGCGLPNYGKSLCRKHYGDARRKGFLSTNKCLIIECLNMGPYKGYCQKHYTRLYRYGNPLGNKKRIKTTLVNKKKLNFLVCIEEELKKDIDDPFDTYFENH